jgi:hypothetical protein
MVSPQRTQRPWQGQVEKKAAPASIAYDPSCYLCPGNTRAGNAQNPKYTGTFVFENDYPALRPDVPEGQVNESGRGLIVAETERGTCKVVCFSPRHDLTIARMAVEDIGLADPNALIQAIAAKDTYDFLGSPEGELALAQATIYLATAPKSNAGYVAFGIASRAATESGSLLPPKHILNAPTKLMKQEGYGGGYRYDHDEPDAFSGQDYFPERLGRQTFYEPVERGFEREIRKRLDWWAKLRAERGGGGEG